MRQTVSGAQVAEAARQYLMEQLSRNYVSLEIMPAAIPSDVSVGPGAVRMKVRELARLAPRSRMVLWVDVAGGTVQSRPVPVPLAVRAMRYVMVARRKAEAGELIGTDHVEVQLRDVAVMPAEPAEPLRPGARVRLRKAVAADEVLLRSDMSSAAGVLRGDRVTLAAGHGAMSVESPALALSDGEPGQRVMVRAVHGEAAVQATVVGSGVVHVED